MDDRILSIVIPYYKETETEVFPLLSSISNQVGVDFSEVECILVNDGTDNEFSGGFLSLFDKLDIKVIMADENKGAGVARQLGLDSATGEYVMFCDADDILHNVAVIGTFLQEIKANKPDIITSLWLEELLNSDTDSYIYINHEDEATWMHGKAFKCEFLSDNSIRFRNDLRVHEDSYFLALAFAMTDNKRKIPFTSYVWRYRQDSITRRNNALYTYDSMPAFNYALGLSFAELEKRGFKEMGYKIVQLVLYNFFTLHQNHWLMPENRKYLVAAEESFWAMIKPYMHYYYNAPPEFISEVYGQERDKCFRGHIESEPLHIWLDRLKRIRGKNVG